MDKLRSPRYPSIGLEEAIERAKKIFERERKNPATREIIAKALGYAGISGKSAGLIGSLRQFGLLSGHDKGLRISDSAVDLIHAPQSSEEYRSALVKAAYTPKLFQEIREHFQFGQPSDESLKYFLVRKGFSEEAREQAAKAFRATAALLEKNIGLSTEEAASSSSPATDSTEITKDSSASRGDDQAPLLAAIGRRDVGQYFERTVLTPGVSVELVFSREPSLEDFEALFDYVEFRMKRLRRSSEANI